jgi:hypothetical protein
MKGNPLLRLSLILIALIAVFWPVFKITRHSETLQLPPPPSIPAVANTLSPKTSVTSTLRVTLLLHAAPSPLHCAISQHGLSLLSEKNLVSPGEYRTAVEITPGEDLLVTATWKDDDPHALRVEALVHGYQAPLEKTFWAQQTLEDTLPIPESFLR